MFQDDMLAALLLQHPTHREPGLTAADDNNVVLFPHAQLLRTGDTPSVATHTLARQSWNPPFQLGCLPGSISTHWRTK
jgi:hypothetical protein